MTIHARICIERKANTSKKAVKQFNMETIWFDDNGLLSCSELSNHNSV